MSHVFRRFLAVAALIAAAVATPALAGTNGSLTIAPVRFPQPKQGGRDAYGAEVTINAGGRRRTVWVNPSQSYLCSNDPRAHFGLGSTTRADDINVVWPDGSEEQFGGVAADQIITLRKGSGQRVASAVTPSGGQ